MALLLPDNSTKLEVILDELPKHIRRMKRKLTTVFWLNLVQTVERKRAYVRNM